jgi:hypothetical protein
LAGREELPSSQVAGIKTFGAGIGKLVLQDGDIKAIQIL